MKKAVFTGYGGVDKIRFIDAERPPLHPQEVLVKVHAIGLNPKDVLVRKGKFKRFSGKKFPMGIGFDFSGVIEDPNGSDFTQGDRVFGMINGWQGRCAAEFVNVSIHELCIMPDKISFEAAAGVPLAGQTALQAIRDEGKLLDGGKILINGASGGVGTLAIQIAKALGGEVTTISSTRNIEFCQSLGADVALSYEELDLSSLREGFEVFFDAFGNQNFRKVAHLLLPKGHYVTTVPKGGIIREQFLNLFRGKKAKLVYVKSNRQDLQWLRQKIMTQRIQPQLDRIFDFEDVSQAQLSIESKRSKGKVVLKLD